MLISEIIWDILEIKHALEDDSDIEELWLLHKINSYRQIFIQQEYALNNHIDPTWLQRYHRFVLTNVKAADDPAIILGSITLSKGTIPKVISLPDDLGCYRIAGSSGILQFEPCDFNTLMMKIEIDEEMNNRYGYYSRIGELVYLYPTVPEASAILIAENPIDIPVNDAGTIRARTFDDEYPLDIGLAQRVVLEICTKDLAISEGSIPDIINDSQRQFKIMRNEGSPRDR